MSVYISGIGLSVPGGEESLFTAPVGTNFRLKKADVSPLGEFVSARELRRMPHITRMALLATGRALPPEQACPPKERTGLVFGSVTGPCNNTLSFLDDIFDSGDEFASPTWFANSVHNSTASQTALYFGFSGPCRFVTAEEQTLQAVLTTAEEWLSSGTADAVLAGIGDEATPILFDSKSSDVVYGEGWCCFYLTRDRGEYGKIDNLYADGPGRIIPVNRAWGDFPSNGAVSLAADLKGKDQTGCSETYFLSEKCLTGISIAF